MDKDTILFADLINFEIVPELHSPVILGPGATEMYLDSPESFDLDNILINAEREMSRANEIVIYEGTGHPE